MLRHALAFVAGLVFAVGLAIGGMTQPARIIGFLDVAGQWDPTLVFVMIGAVGTSMLAYRWVRPLGSPLLGDAFHIPRRGGVDRPLIAGALLFGVGWGISGFCPGPAITVLATGHPVAIGFVLAMLAGMGLYDLTPLSALAAGRPRAAGAGTLPPAEPRREAGLTDA